MTNNKLNKFIVKLYLLLTFFHFTFFYIKISDQEDVLIIINLGILFILLVLSLIIYI